MVFDLFAALDANDDQLDFPTLFASAKDGWAAEDLDDPHTDLAPLFDRIIAHVPPPKVDPDAPFSMLATTLDRDPYLGRVLTGRIYSGVARVNMPVRAMDRDGRILEQGRLTKLLAYRGIERVPVETAEAGDIIAVAGLTGVTVADTIASPEVTVPLPAQPIDPPTLAMTFSVNDSPLAGREGDKVTSRMIRDRLLREGEGNVAIRITETAEKDAYEVAGRGELQLGVLIETMRREGFELSISRPRVLFKTDEVTGQRLEPIEEVVIDVDDDYSGVVVEKLGGRRAEMTEMKPSGGGKTRVVFLAPSRGLIGYQGEFMTDTRGTGVMARLFHHYAPHKGAIPERRNGVLISNAGGMAVAYALWNLEDRGPMFIEPGVDVYEGMIIGEHSRGNDLEVNPLKAKQLTNIRAAGKDEAVRLTPPRLMSLEQAIAYIQDDELCEVTPRAIRLRKRLLDPNERKRASRSREAS
jgi:GTP-binding protein